MAPWHVTINNVKYANLPTLKGHRMPTWHGGKAFSHRDKMSRFKSCSHLAMAYV